MNSDSRAVQELEYPTVKHEQLQVAVSIMCDSSVIVVLQTSFVIM